jgi:hypothetical protein
MYVMSNEIAGTLSQGQTIYWIMQFIKRLFHILLTSKPLSLFKAALTIMENGSANITGFL